jgi:hypothetical protein
MREWRRAFNEVRALKAFVGATLLLCIGLGMWEDMDTEKRVFWMIITPLAFIGSVLWWRRSLPKRKKRQMATAEPETTRRNPPAKVPPPRQET